MLSMYLNWEIKSATQSFNLKKKNNTKTIAANDQIDGRFVFLK